MELPQSINLVRGDESSPVLLIGGPTPAGKSEIALKLAARLSGEIISADSMQVYRGMDIGTPKPSADQRRRIPPHLIHVAQTSDLFHAARFLPMADAPI